MIKIFNFATIEDSASLLNLNIDKLQFKEGFSIHAFDIEYERNLSVMRKCHIHTISQGQNKTKKVSIFGLISLMNM